MDKKTKTLIVSLISQHPNASVTALMKLCYLTDLVAVKETGNKITQFNYIRYKFGPFDKNIYSYLDELTTEKVIVPKQEYTTTGKDFIIYELDEKITPDFSALTSSDRKISKEVIDTVVGHGAKGLTQIAYKTKPMIAIGAEMDNDKGLYQKLNLEL